MNFLISFLSSLLASATFWLGSGFIIWIIIQITQSHFLKFFGLSMNRTMIVYLSNLWQPTEQKSIGYVLSGLEFRVTESLNNLFGNVPFRLPEIVRGLVDTLWIGKKITLKVEVSPLQGERFPFTNMIIVGTAFRNTVRKHYIDTAIPYLVIDGENHPYPPDCLGKTIHNSVRVLKGTRTGKLLEGEYNFAILERLVDDEQGIVVFMCAGFRSDSSRAATEYLVRHWRELARQYKDNAFALCLGFPKSDAYLEDYVDPVIIATFPGGVHRSHDST